MTPPRPLGTPQEGNFNRYSLHRTFDKKTHLTQVISMQKPADVHEVLDSKLEKVDNFIDSSWDIEQEIFPVGLDEQVIRRISTIKNEPSWLLDFRLKAFAAWQKMPEPHWATVNFKPIDYQAISYFAQPKKQALNSLDDLDPEMKRSFDKLGIPLEEQKMLAGVAVDAVVDSVSVATTFQQKLEEVGVLFMPFSQAVQQHPQLVQQYLGSVVPIEDNFFACLNSAVFTDGSFVYVPKGVKCPIELSTYFRINAEGTGQFERTLIIAEEGSFISYLEGCSAPKRDENQLHAAVVELIAKPYSEIKYSTVQNWYTGDKEGKGGIFNFVTKRGIVEEKAQLSWTQMETGSAITWKYPSCILKGDGAIGEFYSVAVTNNAQQADTGTKMIHLGKNTQSRIISKGISAGKSTNTYRGKVIISASATGSRNYTKCDSLMFGNSTATTLPVISCNNDESSVEHEASAGEVDKHILEYCNQRGLSEEQAVNLFVNGFVKEVVKKLPLEFAVEAQKLLEISMEGSVG